MATADAPPATTTLATTPLTPVSRPLNLIPVGLKEAALDSPTFRATSHHFTDQADAVERWLESHLKAASKLVAELPNLDALVNAILATSAPPPSLSEAVLDHDYTLLALRRHGEAAREFWGQTLKGIRRYDTAVVEPIRAFLGGELKGFKDARRALETSQRAFDGAVARYLAQSKTKEASSLREDAFQVHEARRAYLKASLDFCVAAPVLRAGLDRLLVGVFAEQTREMKASRDAGGAVFARIAPEMDRVRGWSREMENSERVFRRELGGARRQIEDSAVAMTRPSRELADYETSTVPFLGSGPASAGMKGQEKGEKQGWLFMKTVFGKPARTVWARRWFFVKNGIFGWLVQGSRSGGVEESEKIGVLLCSTRPAFQEERRFCFEVKTKDSSITLQAETQLELSEWIGAFEMAKRNALADPGSKDSSVSGVDAAFAISPAIPELAAADANNEGRQDEANTGLSAPEREGTGIGNRPSFDVNPARRVMSLEREPGEGSRDHAARIIQKLDLHKRAAPTSSVTPAPPSGGIASLISASHNIFPVGPGTPQNTASPDPSGHKKGPSIPPSSLAPSTLAHPPSHTNLSHTAVVISGDRDVTLLGKSDASGMPSGLMANLWGSSNWGYVNRLGDDGSSRHQRSMSQPSSPLAEPPASVDDLGVVEKVGGASKEGGPQLPATAARHRKTMSVATIPDKPATVSSPALQEADEYPANYPLPLKAQHAQFRMLFPAVPRAEKLILVFRATWNPNEQQEFPGRVYVTTKEIYFYSHHLGFVLITGAKMSSVSEVTAAPGRDCDFLYVHLKGEGEGRRITIRVFLDDLRLLKRRLDYLVRNANDTQPEGLDAVLKTVMKMEFDKPERSSSVESWEDLVYDGHGSAGESRTMPQRRRQRDMKAQLRIDGSLYGDPQNAARTGREVQKFQLPRHAVIYAPKDMQPGITREFGVSAKALFHVVFGDKSAVWQLLSSNRTGDKVSQTPWTKDDRSQWTRKFDVAEGLGVGDRQTVEIWNDHLCYVVANTRRPTGMPFADKFEVVMKVVITHSAKSRCKLAVFQHLQWAKSPWLGYFKILVEREALNALEADALDLTNVAMDQVGRLGNYSKTNKALEIFGGIGQQPSLPQLDGPAIASSGSLAGSNKQRSKPTSLFGLVVSDITVRIFTLLSMVFDLFVSIAKSVIGVCTAHTILLALFAISVTYNSWHAYRDSLSWYHERTARAFMIRLGVKPDPSISRAVYLADMDSMVGPSAHLSDSNANATSFPFPATSDNPDFNNETTTDPASKSCRTTFTDAFITSTSSASSAKTRLHRSRAAFARYRHDLLVALRVINSVERDVVSAEWGQWVRGEVDRCGRVEEMLAQGVGNGQGAKIVAEELEEYCNDCRGEIDALLGREETGWM